MNVDVRICAASPNASSKRSNFPEVPPANMVAQHYEWPELVQLYRDSDVVAVPLRPNPFQAGQTALMEAMACERPVVVTEQVGMVEDFARESLVRTVPEEDPEALRAVIRELLADPERASAQAERGRQRIVESFNTDRYVEHLAALLRGT
jgi:glycosyltransferase involved in cell wall biosynthesis